MKKTTIIIIALFVMTAVLGICFAVSESRNAEVKELCTASLYGGIRELTREIASICESGEYGQQSRETIAASLEQISNAVSVMNVYDQNFKTFSAGLFGLTQVLGMWSLQINDFDAESIPYDGRVSDKELDFLWALRTDLDALLTPMLAADGLNMREGLTYSDMRDALKAFCLKYETWNPAYEPYDLLN